MPSLGRFAPATSRRAFFFGALLALSAGGLPAAAPTASFPELAQVDKPDAKEAARLIAQFRNSGLPGDYYLEFELRGLPRRGEGVTLQGRWWGSRNDQGAISRIEVVDSAGATHRFLLQNGDEAAVWRVAADGRPARLTADESLAPLVPGVEIAAFDLLMPFLYWPGATVEKVTRVLGRPAHAFLFPAPAAFGASHADIGAARAYLDTQFNVPMQTEIIGKNGRVTKTLALLSLKTVDKQTLPKAADYRNEITRDKTRLQITGAALNLSLSRSVFAPDTLSRAVAPPAPTRITRLDP